MVKDPYAEIKMLLAGAGSHIFSVHFFKKDHSPRIMKVQNALAKFNVKSDVDPAKRAAIEARAANNHHLLNVWDIEAGDFRSVNMNTLYEVHLNGKVYDVQDLHCIEREPL